MNEFDLSSPPLDEGPSPLVQRGLFAAIAVLLVAGLVAGPLTPDDAATNGGPGRKGGDTAAATSTTVEGDEALTPESTTSTSTSLPADGVGAGTGTTVGTTPTTSRGTVPPGSIGGPTTTRQTAPPGPADAGPFAVTKPGAYPYKLTSTSPGSPDGRASSVNLEVATVETASGVTRQTQTEAYPTKRLTSRISWRSDGLYEDVFVASTGDDKIECDWTPDYLQVPSPLQTGMTFASEGTCRRDDGPKQVELRRKDTAKVTGTEKLTVGGQGVDVWVIERAQVVTQTVRDGSTTRTDRVEHQAMQRWAPKQGLLVREERTYTRIPEGAPSETYTENRELQRLTP